MSINCSPPLHYLTHLDRDSVSLAELVSEVGRTAETTESAVHQDPQSLTQLFTFVHAADRRPDNRVKEGRDRARERYIIEILREKEREIEIESE